MDANRLAISEARDDLTETVNRVAYTKERVIIHRRGKDLVAVVPIEDLEALEALEDRLDAEAGRKALAEWEAEGRPTVPLANVIKRFEERVAAEGLPEDREETA
jgi:prevent-host-death family protein